MSVEPIGVDPHSTRAMINPVLSVFVEEIFKVETFSLGVVLHREKKFVPGTYTVFLC